MFVKMRKGELKKLICFAVQKAGSERMLTEAVGIPPITIYYYKHEMYNISQERYASLSRYLGIPDETAEHKQEALLPSNWGRKKGGRNSVAMKKKNGTWISNLDKMRKGSSRHQKAWHKRMKREHPLDYYNSQYTKFKKVGGYKLVSMRGEKVRNSLEKEVADLLRQMGLEYEYEPLVKGKTGYYFPDFKVGKIMIECSMWRGEEKAYKLLHKIKDLQKAGYCVVVIVPMELRHFYKVLDVYLVTDLEELKRKLICLGSSVTS